MTFVLANWQEFLEILPENISEFYAVKIEIVYGDAAGPTAVCQCWRMCFNHFNSWRVRLPSGWSAVLPATWMYESSAAKYVLTFLKTMTHHYGEKSPYSYLLISFYSMETEMSTEGNVFRSREVGGKKKIKAPKIGCTCFRLCSCCTQNVFLNEVNLFAWFYIYGSLLSTCKISLWQLPHTQGGWTKAVKSGGEKILTHWQ